MAVEDDHRPGRARFFWRVGERPAAGQTEFEELNAPAVVPRAFPEWAETMDGWGGKVRSARHHAHSRYSSGRGAAL